MSLDDSAAYDKGGWIQPPAPISASFAIGEFILTAEQAALAGREYMKRYGDTELE